MTVLAFLQNMWFKDPERAQQTLDHYLRKGKGRNRFIRDMLFFGCLTGRRLREAFGEELCDDIIWEEASPGLHGAASACPPADPDHMLAALDRIRPDVVLTFGRVALDGFRAAMAGAGRDPEGLLIACPHPAARGSGTMTLLRAAAAELRQYLEMKQ